jgi:hydroxymethylpyrimidine pyrophosphatase-like HAD family hydrolase
MALGNDGNNESMLDWAGHPRAVSQSPAAAKGVYPLVESAASGGFEHAVRDALEIFDERRVNSPANSAGI